jgi:DNA adenine methylase
MAQQLVFEQCDLGIKGTPLFRWPGGKRALLKHLLPLLNKTFNRYYEPFFGGGALFFAVQPESAILSDTNPDLINCYTQVRDRPDEVIAHLSKLKNTEKDYYKIRDKVPADDVGRAARLIYLSALSFNGIYRLNSKGLFNVPYGYRTQLRPCDPIKIKAVSQALSSARLCCGDFEESVAGASEGDLIYVDPPYTVAHSNNGFLKYNAKIFSWDDQLRLATLVKDLVRRGCYVLISNADHYSILELYKDFKLQKVERTSIIAASASNRRLTTECIFYNEV